MPKALVDMTTIPYLKHKPKFKLITKFYTTLNYFINLIEIKIYLQKKCTKSKSRMST